MAIATRLDLRHTQTLVMTPQLQQAIKLLQMSNLELAVFVEQEIERNPLLERSEGAEGERAEDEDAEAASEPGPEAAEADAAADESGPAAEIAEAAAERDGADLTGEPSMSAGAEPPLDADYENRWDGATAADAGGPLPEAFANWGSGRGGSFEERDYDL